ncbi:MAG: hypothetical protein ACI4F9_05870 [Lachnospiraceae bacterium]
MLEKIRTLNETVLDLFIGILIYCVIAEIIGLFFVNDKIVYTVALWIGGVSAGGWATDMYLSLDTALDFQESEAIKYMRKRSFFRIVVILLIGIAGMLYSWTAFVGVLVGFFSLKLAAYAQPITNLYITKKIKKERR